MLAPPAPRELEFWTPQPLFAGETVFIMASGPSMSQAVADRVRGHGRAIVINATYRLAPWADIWFFTDNSIFAAHRQFAERFKGEIITLSSAAKRAMPDRIKRVHSSWSSAFPRGGSEMVRQGRSSGHTAISIAIAMGATRIILLGYDMRVVEGREHHHDDYAGRRRDLAIYAREFLPAFKGWNANALAAGVEILNATPGSALTEFPPIDLDEALACCAAS